MSGGSVRDLEQVLVDAARAKIAAGEVPSQREQNALRKWEATDGRVQFWKAVSACPKGYYEEMSGRRRSVLDRQAVTFGIPCSGESIDLPAVIRAFHEMLAKDGRRISQVVNGWQKGATGGEFDDPLMEGGDSEDGNGDLWLARYREEKTGIARLERLQKEGSLLPRADVYEVLGRSAALIRQMQEDLERKFGADAADVAKAALDGLEREMASYFGESDAA